MPEEKNRILIDHLSDFIYVYLKRYKNLLLSEGISPKRIKVVGNIIVDALREFLPIAEKKSNILERLHLKSQEYILCTLHREENIENKDIFVSKIKDLIRLSRKYPIVFPVMPRVRKKIKICHLTNRLRKSNIICVKPLGYLDFLKLEKYAKVVITDSGSVQEETLILGVPCLVSRRSTERPETIWAGATIISDENLYKKALQAISLKKKWNRNILNPQGGSPSKRIYEDLIKKIKNGFFKKSREFKFIKSNKFVRQAYNK